MPKPDLKDLTTANEIDLTVRGRKSGQDISRPVWFVHEDDKLYLLPVQGSDTNWYRNVLKNPNVKISAQRQELSGKARTIIDDKKVKEIVEKFRSKYGISDVQKYYSKFDVGIELYNSSIKGGSNYFNTGHKPAQFMLDFNVYKL